MAELHRRKHMKPREKVTVDSDGTVHINYTVDAEPIMDAMKAYGDLIDRHSARRMHRKLVGSIDPITARLWSKECGSAIGTKEFNKFAANRIKNDIDYRRFKVGG